MDTVATITTAADVLVASNPLWSHGRILLQTATHAALLYKGTLCSIWHGEVTARNFSHETSHSRPECMYNRSVSLQFEGNDW